MYTRHGCGLCRTAERLVQREARRAEVRIVDIDQHSELRSRYDVLVPVVTVDGVRVAQLELVRGVVRRAVRRARARSSAGR